MTQRIQRWTLALLAIAVIATPWDTAAADNLPMKLISPDVKAVQPLNSSYVLKVQTEAGAECIASLSTAFANSLTLPKQTADQDGYVSWTVQTGGLYGSRNAWITCNHNGKKGSLTFAYRQS